MKTEDIIRGEAQYILQTYGRPEFVLERGNGVYLFDMDGNRYLDFVSGLAVNALGYGDYEVLKAIEAQAAKLMHVSNLYHTIPSVEVAKRLVEHSFADRVFFCNSGTEAWEATLKFCRKWGNTTHDQPKNRLIAFENSFQWADVWVHLDDRSAQVPTRGLSRCCRALTSAQFNDLASVESLVSDQTCAILVEPVQAEGGINAATAEFLTGLRCLVRRAGYAAWSSTRSKWGAGA